MSTGKAKETDKKKGEKLTRVWVITDTGRETTGYVKSDGEWFINCPRIRATGAKVLRWKEG
ncbi:50S ribosomal protein L13 [Escherichia coli]|nr:50S ribosomal protein L13 [Escherichia coli]HBA2896523.1 50S ribosomal protein L13 [Escherichia coli]